MTDAHKAVKHLRKAAEHMRKAGYPSYATQWEREADKKLPKWSNGSYAKVTFRGAGADSQTYESFLHRVNDEWQYANGGPAASDSRVIKVETIPTLRDNEIAVEIPTPTGEPSPECIAILDNLSYISSAQWLRNIKRALASKMTEEKK